MKRRGWCGGPVVFGFLLAAMIISGVVATYEYSAARFSDYNPESGNEPTRKPSHIHIEKRIYENDDMYIYNVNNNRNSAEKTAKEHNNESPYRSAEIGLRGHSEASTEKPSSSQFEKPDTIVYHYVNGELIGHDQDHRQSRDQIGVLRAGHLNHQLATPVLYDPADETCCAGAVYSKVQGSLCCGNHQIDEKTSMCCGAVPHLRHPSKVMRCCGNHTYDVQSELCCRGKPAPIPAHLLRRYDPSWSSNKDVKCCGDEVYNSSDQSCARKWINDGQRFQLHTKLGPNHETNLLGGSLRGHSRHSRQFDEQDNGELFKIKCGDEIISTQTQLCCDGVVHAKPAGFSRQVCCGRRLIDSYAYGCLPNGVAYNRQHERPCGNTTFANRMDAPTLECCNGTVYNREHDTCCHGAVVVGIPEYIRFERRNPRAKCCRIAPTIFSFETDPGFNRTLTECLCGDRIINGPDSSPHLKCCGGRQAYDDRSEICCAPQRYRARAEVLKLDPWHPDRNRCCSLRTSYFSY